MSVRIRCTTTFDITATNQRGRARDNDTVTNLRRNQQRNWDTLNQLLSLRTLPENITDPVSDTAAGVWSFAFDVPDLSAITDDIPMDLLINDCNGVPMITGLTESPGHSAVIKTHAPDVNLWFDLESDK